MEIHQPSGGEGGGGVDSLNGLTGDVTLAAGSNITITPSGQTLTIASTGGSSFWSRATGFLYPTTISDWVGIGSNTPITTLSLDGSNNLGNLTFANSATTAIQGGMGIESANNSIVIGATIGDLSIYGGTGKINFSADYGSTNQMVLTDTGRLGVGITAPLATGHFKASVTTVGDPTVFTAVLVPEVLDTPGTDSLSLIYGPLDPTAGTAVANLGSTGYLTDQIVSLNYIAYAYRNIGGSPYISPNGDAITFAFPSPGDQTSDNGSVENSMYGGYINNDIVHAVVYSYRNDFGAGILYTSSGFTLPTITLINNPSGVDWNWTADICADGSSVSGYVIEVTDITTNTVYSYDVGNVLTYADMNVGGTVAYTPFSGASIAYGVDVSFTGSTNGDGSAVNGYNLVNSTVADSYDLGLSTTYTDTRPGGSFSTNPFTSTIVAAGQTFFYDMFTRSVSPSGVSYYVQGASYNISDMVSNASLFWVSHSILATGDWQEQENSGNFMFGSGNTDFYEKAIYTDSSSTTPVRYGIQSNGSILTRDYQAYTSDGVIYSSGYILASTSDPNDSNYYSITYTQANPSSNLKALENIASGGFTGRTVNTPTFYQDALAGAFVESNTVIPTSSQNKPGYFENSATYTDSVPQLILNSNASNGTKRITLSFRNSDTERGNIYVDENNTLTLNPNSNSSVSIRASSGTSTGVMPALNFVDSAGTNISSFGTDGSLALKRSASSSTATLTLGPGGNGTTQLLFDTQSTLPSSPITGGIEYDGLNWYGSTGATRQIFVRTRNASALGANYIPVAGTSGYITDSPLHLVAGVLLVLDSGYNFEAKGGITIDSGKDLSLGDGSKITGTIRTNYLARTANTTISTGFNIFNATSNSFNFTLPTSVGISGTQWFIQNSGSGTSTLNTTSAQTINGQASGAITFGQYKGLMLISDGANWISPGCLGSAIIGSIPLTSGGLNASLTASNGGIFYSTATAGAILAGTATAGQILLSGATAAPSWSTATYPATAGTAGNALISDGTNFVSTAPNTAQSTPSNPTGTTDTTGKMMGLAGAITPASSGKILVIISGSIKNDTVTDGATVQITYGTGTAPTNGAALTGTATGNAVAWVNETVSVIGLTYAPGTGAFSCNAIVSGLTVSTAYWLDLRLKAVTGGTATVSNISISAVEL